MERTQLFLTRISGSKKQKPFQSNS
uniref:Uncharacterized protein n=1 Tax=Rhizophora mucronata TaxID=61149 RepID=A0A2P2L574_RHIMU